MRGAIMANQEITTERGRRDPSRSFLNHPLMSLQNEVDRVFGDFFQNFEFGRLPGFANGSLVPKADFSESETAYELAVEIPGVSGKDLEVSTKNGVLTVKGEKKTESEEKKKDFIRSERSYGSYCRAMALPEDADESKISAHYKNGVLVITMPKSAEAKSKSHKIEIQQS
jgi:HSP20 family protein